MKLNKSLLITDAQTGLFFSTFLGTAALFFTGLLIAQFNSFNPTIRIPILYLVICTFAFIFSAIVYANGSGVVARHDHKLAGKYIKTGNAISEYLGAYLFVISIPLVINAVTEDTFLRNSVGAIAVLSISLYSVSNFSLLNRFISEPAKYIVTLLITVVAAGLFITQIYLTQYFISLATIFLVTVIATTTYYYFNE